MLNMLDPTKIYLLEVILRWPSIRRPVHLAIFLLQWAHAVAQRLLRLRGNHFRVVHVEMARGTYMGSPETACGAINPEGVVVRPLIKSINRYRGRNDIKILAVPARDQRKAMKAWANIVAREGTPYSAQRASQAGIDYLEKWGIGVGRDDPRTTFCSSEIDRAWGDKMHYEHTPRNTANAPGRWDHSRAVQVYPAI